MIAETNALQRARDAALAALTSWAARRNEFPAERAELVAVAWLCGERRVAALARAADVSRDTIYADLRAHHIDPAARDEPPRTPNPGLRPDALRQAADAAAAALNAAMLIEDPEPLTLAGWQAGIALTRVAEAASAAPGEPEGDRIGALRDLAVRADYVRRYANQALAAALPDERIAAVVEQEKSLAYDLQEAFVTGATLHVYLPEQDRQITITLGERGGTDPLAGWSTWQATDATPLPEITAHRHLEITAALTNLADLITTEPGPVTHHEQGAAG